MEVLTVCKIRVSDTKPWNVDERCNYAPICEKFCEIGLWFMKMVRSFWNMIILIWNGHSHWSEKSENDGSRGEIGVDTAEHEPGKIPEKGLIHSNVTVGYIGCPAGVTNCNREGVCAVSLDPIEQPVRPANFLLPLPAVWSDCASMDINDYSVSQSESLAHRDYAQIELRAGAWQPNDRAHVVRKPLVNRSKLEEISLFV